MILHNYPADVCEPLTERLKWPQQVFAWDYQFTDAPELRDWKEVFLPLVAGKDGSSDVEFPGQPRDGRYSSLKNRVVRQRQGKGCSE